jgi:hypothetical protein
MKKIVTLIGTLALASTLAITGCKKKEEAAKEPAMEAPKPAEPPAADPAAVAPAPAPAADPAAAAVPAGDLPAECTELKGALEKLAACDKIPAATKDAFKNTWTGIETAMKGAVSPEAKTQLGSSCKASVEGVKAAAAACM